MFAKLAFRNIRRQLGNYLIYFLTVLFTVALLFAFNTLIYSAQLQGYAENIKILRQLLTVISVFMAVVISFIIGYATSFLIRLRKREFGMYLTLGMTRKDILYIFVLETLLFNLAATAIGLVLGLFLYQGMMAIMTHLLEMKPYIAPYSVQGLWFTVCLVFVVYLLSSVTSMIYLKRVSIGRLLQKSTPNAKIGRHWKVWLAVTVITLVALLYFCNMLCHGVIAIYVDGNADGTAVAISILKGLVGTSVSVFLLCVGICRGGVFALLQSKKFCCRGTNRFTLRQLSKMLGTNAVMSGILSLLLVYSITAISISFTLKHAEKVAEDRFFLFDIYAGIDSDAEEGLTIEEGYQIIQKHCRISDMALFDTYTNGDGYITWNFSPWSKEEYPGITDQYFRESDYNEIMRLLGKDTISCHDSFYIVSAMPEIETCDFSNAVLEKDGISYTYAGTIPDMPIVLSSYLLIVVPDAFVDGLETTSHYAAIMLAGDNFDAFSLADELSYETTYQAGDGQVYTTQTSDFIIKKTGHLEQTSTFAVIIVGTLYGAAICLFVSMAILALKTLAGISEDRERFCILHRLGADRTEQERTLFRQTACFFFFPLLLPAALSIPTGKVCAAIMAAINNKDQIPYIYGIVIVAVLTVTAIYLLYYMAVYYVAKKKTLP